MAPKKTKRKATPQERDAAVHRLHDLANQVGEATSTFIAMMAPTERLQAPLHMDIGGRLMLCGLHIAESDADRERLIRDALTGMRAHMLRMNIQLDFKLLVRTT